MKMKDPLRLTATALWIAFFSGACLGLFMRGCQLCKPTLLHPVKQQQER